MRFLQTGQQGLDMMARGDYRRGADKCIQAVIKDAPSKNAKFRYYFFFMYTMTLREMHFTATDKELKVLEQQFLYNTDEPPHFRIAASFCLGVVLSSQAGDRESAADAYREGLLVGQKATPQERSVLVTCDTGDFLASYFMDSHCETIQNNLNIMLGKGGHRPGLELRNDGTPMPLVGNFEKVTITSRNVHEFSQNDLFERVKVVGGEACEYCQKTKEELGLEQLNCCARCKFMYYCSKECQKAAWKAGHKSACRKPDQIEMGDYMKLTGLAKVEWNGQLVKVIGKDKSGRWTVEALHNGKRISVAADKLKHIRPSK